MADTATEKKGGEAKAGRPPADRNAYLAAQLRANLRRRKEQSAKRASLEANEPVDSEG